MNCTLCSLGCKGDDIPIVDGKGEDGELSGISVICVDLGGEEVPKPKFEWE